MMMTRMSSTIIIMVLVAVSVNLQGSLVQAADPTDLTGCGATKTCFLQPSGCTSEEDCTVGVTWGFDPSNDYVDMELFVKAQGWVAVGLSLDTSMGNDSVSACIYDPDTDVGLIQTFNGPRNGSPALNNPMFGVNLITSSVGEGTTRCSFQRQVMAPADGEATDQDRFYAANELHWIMLAWSAQTGTRITQAHMSSSRFITPVRMNITAPIEQMVTVVIDETTTTVTNEATTTTSHATTVSAFYSYKYLLTASLAACLRAKMW